MAFKHEPDSTLRVDGAVLKGVKGGIAQVSDAPISAHALLCLVIFRTQGMNTLWIANDVREMERLHESLGTLAKGRDGPPGRPPSTDEAARSAIAPYLFLFQPMEKDPAVFGEHLKLVQHLSEQNPFVIVTCPQALEKEVPTGVKSEQAVRTLRLNEDQPRSELTGWMSDAGYEFGVEVYAQGEAAIRGGILDCWPPGSPRPVRIEFFGDEIDSIRFFDDQTQCSVEKIDAVQLPQLDFGFAGDETCPLTDLLPENTLIVNPSDPTVTPQPSRLTTGFDFYDTNLQAVSFDLHPKAAEQARRRFVEQRCSDLSNGWNIHLFFETKGTLTRFKELYDDITGFDALQLHYGVLHESAIDPARKILIITESDFYAYHSNRSAHARSAKRFRKQERVSEAADIQPGDFVVHVEHGVGKYLGIVETSFSGKSIEVLSIEYAKGEKVYLPVTQAHLLTRYKGMGKQTPKPHTLGGRKWRNDKATAQEAVQDLAAKLLQTQAERQAKRGYKFAKDTAMQAEFEAAFPYTETADQLD